MFFSTLINGTLEEKAQISFNLIAAKHRDYFELADVSELIKDLLQAGTKGLDVVHVYDYDLSLGDQVFFCNSG